MELKRYATFAKRFMVARRLGIKFRGTSKTEFPSRIRLNGSWISFERHRQSSELHDLIDVMLDDVYGLRSVQNVQSIIDIGANIGLFSAYARHVFPDACIHAYEPDPISFRFAKENLAGMATVYYEGVFSSETRASMKHRSAAANTNQTVPDETGEIKLIPFRSVLERMGGKIDLLKVDCEGAEWHFMNDAELFGNVRRVRMEYHLSGRHNVDDVRAMARNLGFYVSALIENGEYFGIVWFDR